MRQLSRVRATAAVLACSLAPALAHADSASVDHTAPPAGGASARGQAASLVTLLARTTAVAKEVSKIRGLPVKRAIPNDVVDRAELKRRLLALAAEEKTHVQTGAESLALQRWGLLPLGTDYEAMLVELLTEQIAGYYDPDTKRLTVSESAGDDPQWAEIVLAHEIDHALQDQAFGLDAFQKVADDEGDAELARRALVEGDGVVLMYEVVLARKGAAAPWSNVEITEGIARSMDTPSVGPAGAAGVTGTGSDALDRAPLAVRESLVFPYRAGFSFVAALRRREPWAAVDAAFKRPPRSTEQIIHPERYLADDVPVPLAITALPSLPLTEYRRAYSTVWGELGFDVFLRAHGVDPAAAAQAAAGWGGDRAVTFALTADPRAETAIGVERSEWDSEADAIEAAEALVRAFDHTLGGAAIARSDLRTTWFAVDGTLTWVERRGSGVVVVTGAPATMAGTLPAEVWTASPLRPAATVRARRGG